MIGNATLVVHAGPALAAAPATTSGLCMVLQGQWQWRGRHGASARLLQAGQGLWWMDERIQSADLASTAQPADAALIQVALQSV